MRYNKKKKYVIINTPLPIKVVLTNSEKSEVKSEYLVGGRYSVYIRDMYTL